MLLLVLTILHLAHQIENTRSKGIKKHKTKGDKQRESKKEKKKTKQVEQ